MIANSCLWPTMAVVIDNTHEQVESTIIKIAMRRIIHCGLVDKEPFLSDWVLVTKMKS